MARGFVYLTESGSGRRAGPFALALAAVRPTASGVPYHLTMGPIARDDGSPWSGVSVDLGLYASPELDAPIHSTLAGLASEVTPGVWRRGFFLRDLAAHLPAFVGREVFGVADGPGWRVVVPIRVIPDAQRWQG